jgi:hypothetical protein
VVVRYSPDPASGELLNIGVVVLSPGHRFMASRFLDFWKRVTQTFPDADKVHLRRIASALERSCERYYAGSQLSLQEPGSTIDVAFDAALPREDAAIVRSAPLTGITSDPERTLNELFERYVAARDPVERRVARDDSTVWRSVSAQLKAKDVLERLRPRTVEGKHYKLHFEHAWQNGRWNVARALSFDMLDPDSIATKAASWSGRILALDADVGFHLVVGLPSAGAPVDVREAAAHGLAILKDQLEAGERAEIIPEGEAASFAERVAREILDHEAAE